MKVCIIYGSESGNSERAVKAIAKTWQGSNFEIGEIMEGATAAVRGFAALAEQYDFLVVATSSNGEGDPPFNFHPFLKALYAADDAGDVDNNWGVSASQQGERALTGEKEAADVGSKDLVEKPGVQLLNARAISHPSVVHKEV